MKTLIFNGSPRRDGNTAALINEVTQRLAGEYKIVEAFFCNISSCIDCRFCRNHRHCPIDDGMGEVYEYIRECDNIIIASPLNFSELTGRLLSVLSRLQLFYNCEVFGGVRLIEKEKRGGIIIAGGGDGSPDCAIRTARIALHRMNVKKIAPVVCSLGTDTLPAPEDQAAMAAAANLADFLSEKN